MLRDIDTHKHHGGMLCEVEFGVGFIDMRGQMRALVDDGYDNGVSFSSIWRPAMMWHGEIDEGDFTEAGTAQTMRFNLYNLQSIMNSNSMATYRCRSFCAERKIRHE